MQVGSLDGLVLVVTGAGRGIGREVALECARSGARIILNNRSRGAVVQTADEIRAFGGEAIVHVGDVSQEGDARELIETANDAYGRLDGLINNAGIVRDRMIANLTVGEWDEVIRVNLRGVFLTVSNAVKYWRSRAKETGSAEAAIVNMTSSAGLFRNAGQANYAAAKAGVASFTINAAYELARYGVTSNGVAPIAATRMSEHLIDPGKRGEGGFDPYAAQHVAPLVAWLVSPEARDVSGRIFEVKGGRIAVAEGWRIGPEMDVGRKWEVGEIGVPLRELLARAQPNRDVTGRAS